MLRSESEPLFSGISANDIQLIFQQTVESLTDTKFRVVSFDASYLYNFDLSDFNWVRKLNLLGRYDKRHVIEWHRYLERWYNDQTVRNDFDRQIKPDQLVRQLDKVVNEGLEMMAGSITGEESSIFKYSAIGDADDLTTPKAGDTQLGNEISRIDVTETAEGGSLSRDGSVIYIIGNHPSSIASTTITESGVFDTNSSTTDRMLDHSVFSPGIDHNQFERAPGFTTVIYMCGL